MREGEWCGAGALLEEGIQHDTGAMGSCIGAPQHCAGGGCEKDCCPNLFSFFLIGIATCSIWFAAKKPGP